jgi:hypothetical protein
LGRARVPARQLNLGQLAKRQILEVCADQHFCRGQKACTSRLEVASAAHLVSEPLRQPKHWSQVLGMSRHALDLRDCLLQGLA